MLQPRRERTTEGTVSHGIYQATAGAVARLNQIDVSANNVANVDTPGHRAQSVTFQGVLHRAGAPASHMVISSETVLNTAAGVPIHTGRPTDFALNEPGYVRAVGPKGEVALIRTASIDRDAEGYLTDGGIHRFVDDDDIPIRTDVRLPFEVVQDGRIRQGETDVGQLRFQQVADEASLKSVGSGTYQPTAESGEPFELANTVLVGHIEGSNANVLEGMVKLIHLERGYQAAMKTIQAYREADEQLIERTSR